MPSESASIMKKAYQELIKLTSTAVFLTPEEEERVKAEIEIQFGLSPARSQRMIDNMVKTQRLTRHNSNTNKIDMRVITPKEAGIPKKEMEEIDKRLKAKPGKQ